MPAKWEIREVAGTETWDTSMQHPKWWNDLKDYSENGELYMVLQHDFCMTLNQR